MFYNVKKILIFKLCCFGDSVFITPAIRSLKSTFPDSEIIYAHADWIRNMIPFIPDIDRGILFENVYEKSILKKIKGTLRFIRMIRSEKIDMVFYGHRTNLLSFVLMLCGIRYRLGYQGTKYLTHRAIFINSLPEFERYQRILSDNDIRAVSSLPSLKRPEVNSHREKLKIAHGEKVLGIFPKGGNNPGTEMDIKKLDFMKYAQLAKKVNTIYPEIRVIFFEGTGSNEKFELPGDIKAAKETIKNELIACCNYFISGDTGSLHIAAAMGISTVSVFGPSDPRILAPPDNENETVRHFYVWKKPECSPCYTPESSIDRKNRKYWKDNTFICHTGTHICMKNVSHNDVFAELEKLLNTANPVN